MLDGGLRLDLRDKIADVPEENWRERRGEVVAHAGNDDQFGAGDALGGVLGGGCGDHGIVGAVQDERGTAQLF